MVKKSRCPHKFVIHERGRWVETPTGQTKVVVEVCVKCGKKKELKFQEEVG